MDQKQISQSYTPYPYCPLGTPSGESNVLHTPFIAPPSRTPSPTPAPTPFVSYTQTQPKQSGATRLNSGGLNGAADWVLEKIADFGGFTERILGTTETEQTAFAAPSSIAQTQDNLNNLYLEGVTKRLKAGSRTWDIESAARFFPGRFKLPTSVKVMSKLGGAADAATGIISLAQAVKKDREIGDKQYTGTIKSLAGTTLQMSVGSLAGIAAGTVLAAAAAPTAAVVIAGGAVAAVTGWGIKKSIDWIG